MRSNTRSHASWVGWITLGLIALCCHKGVAQPVALYLEDIEKIQASERGGDELFFTIAAYPSEGRAQLSHVPDFPVHWHSKHLQGVKHVPLWQKDLQDGEAVQLIVALNERDAAPWTLDDQLGSLKLRVRREGVRLLAQWFDQTDGLFVLVGEGMQPPHDPYVWQAHGGHYRVRLRLKE